MAPDLIAWRSGRLGIFAGSHDNNFNLIRVVAALMVLVSHSYVLATGRKELEPLVSIGTSLGGVAVDIFFVTSGYLVTASLLSRNNAVDFVSARALRIYPALLVATFLTVLVAGPLATELPITSYLLHPETLLHLLRNSTLVTGISHSLPGVFVGNPYPNAVNSSLWSLPYEIGMYCGLFALWVATRLMSSNAGSRMASALIAIALLALAAHIVASIYWRPSSLLRLTWMFAAGALLQVFRDRVTATPGRLVVVMAAILGASVDRHLFLVVYPVLLPYAVITLAYVPAGRIRSYNLLGDYSYGIYIYAFPIQQGLAYAIPAIGVGAMLFWSSILTIVAGVLSWHFIERRALALRDRSTRIPRLEPVNASAE